MLTCPNSKNALKLSWWHGSSGKEWTQRHVKYSEREILMTVLKDGALDEQRHPKWLQVLYSLVC
jgi:hypothetical protein